MAPVTLLDFIHAQLQHVAGDSLGRQLVLGLIDELTLPARERIGTAIGEQLGALCVRYPRAARAALAELARAGVRGAGWALVSLDFKVRT